MYCVPDLIYSYFQKKTFQYFTSCIVFVHYQSLPKYDRKQYQFTVGHFHVCTFWPAGCGPWRSQCTGVHCEITGCLHCCTEWLFHFQDAAQMKHDKEPLQVLVLVSVHVLPEHAQFYPCSLYHDSCNLHLLTVWNSTLAISPLLRWWWLGQGQIYFTNCISKLLAVLTLHWLSERLGWPSGLSQSSVLYHIYDLPCPQRVLTWWMCRSAPLPPSWGFCCCP